jgi:hypothetical protein
MHDVDPTAKLVRYEVSNNAGTVARSRLWPHGWASALLPLDAQLALGAPVPEMVPAHGDTPVFGRECTEFCSVGGKLVEHHRYCLPRLGAQDDVRSAIRVVPAVA